LFSSLKCRKDRAAFLSPRLLSSTLPKALTR
jgi:hypothetical protein